MKKVVAEKSSRGCYNIKELGILACLNTVRRDFVSIS